MKLVISEDNIYRNIVQDVVKSAARVVGWLILDIALYGFGTPVKSLSGIPKFFEDLFELGDDSRAIPGLFDLLGLFDV